MHEFLRCLQNIAARQLAEVRQIVRDYFGEPEALEPVNAADLLARLELEDVVVDVLRSHGFRARRLDVGLPDWRARGLAVAEGATATLTEEPKEAT